MATAAAATVQPLIHPPTARPADEVNEDITGSWTFYADSTFTDDDTFQLKEDSDGGLTGTFVSTTGTTATLTGYVSGSEISFSWNSDYPDNGTFNGTVSGDGDSIFGSWDNEGASTIDDSFTLVGQGATGSDLSASITSDQPQTLQPGDTDDVEFQLSNAGPDEADGTYSIAFDLETTPNTGSGDFAVGSSSGSTDLDAGSLSDDMDATVTVPDGIAAGTYYLVGTLSDGGGITDTDTSDKTFYAGPITIGATLSGEFTGTVPSTAATGDTISPALELTDSSDAADIVNGDETTQYSLSTTPDTAGTLTPLVANNYALNLDAGDSYDESQTVTIPDGLTPGKYYLIAQPDSTQAISITDKEVYVVSGPIEIASADLSGTFTTQPPDALATGDSGDVAFTVTNAADADEADGSFNVTFELESGTAALGNGDTPAGTATGTVDLDAGDTSDPINGTIDIPSDAEPGTYYVAAIIDDNGNGITDTNTSDKTFFSGPITVGGGSDLSATFSTQPPTDIIAGGDGTAAFTVTDAGPDPATGSVSATFDLVPTGDDADEGDTIDGITTSTATIADDVTDPGPVPVSFTIPKDTPAGTYTLVGTLSDSGFTDNGTDDKTFTSSTITVADDGFEFITQPKNANTLATMKPVKVELVDADGDPETDAKGEVTLTLDGDTDGGTLSGRTTATLEHGFATFDDLKVSRAGTYTLEASDGQAGDDDATSDSFEILKEYKIHVDFKALLSNFTTFLNDLEQTSNTINQLLSATPGFTFYPPKASLIEPEGEISGKVDVTADGEIESGSLAIEGSIGGDLTTEAYWGLPYKVFGFGISGKVEVKSSIGAEVKWEDGEVEYSGGAKDTGAVTLAGNAYVLYYKGEVKATGALEIPTTLSSDGNITSNFSVTGSLGIDVLYKGPTEKKYTTDYSVSREFGPDNLLTYTLPLSELVGDAVDSSEDSDG